MEIALATPRQIYISAGLRRRRGNRHHALLLQMGRHPALLLASVALDPCRLPRARPLLQEPSSQSPRMRPNADLGVQRGLATAPLRETDPAPRQASAPDITSSIAPAAQDKQHQSSAPKAHDVPPRSARPNRRSLARQARRRIVPRARCPDRAREARICGQVRWRRRWRHRRALRHFERARGLTPTTKISSELVKQLTRRR